MTLLTSTEQGGESLGSWMDINIVKPVYNDVTPIFNEYKREVTRNQLTRHYHLAKHFLYLLPDRVV